MKDFQAISSIEEPITKSIDLYEAIARAPKSNLDVQVKTMQVQLAHQELNLAHCSALLQVSANVGCEGRNDFGGGVGQLLITGLKRLNPLHRPRQTSRLAS
ncbi:MAG: hypothetical protein P0120_23560 [Nitrospira sp.]|nr:hypothetical protein [Nitrospira sp.]